MEGWSRSHLVCQFHGQSRVWISFIALLTFIEFCRIRTGGVFSAWVQRDSAGCCVEHKRSFQKSQKSLPAPAYPCSPKWEADGPAAPGKSLSSLTTLKALPFYIRLLISAIFIVIVNSDMILTVLLLFIYACMSISDLQHIDFRVDYCICSISVVWSPKFYKSSIRCYILLCWNKMPKLQGSYRLCICIYMQIWLCFVLWNWSYIQLKIVLKNVHRPNLSWTFILFLP